LAGYADRRIVLRDGLVIADEMNPEPQGLPRDAALAEG
jgi:putative ABC transport system ATP-binding protein